MAIKIIIDSTADMPAEDRERCPIVPLSVVFGEEEYVDGVTLSKDEFYNKLETAEELPHTSQAGPAAFAGLFEEIIAKGDEAIVIALASQFSGTYQSAVIAAEDHENIRVVDSGNVTIGCGILAQYALRLVDEGRTVDEIVEALEEKKKRVRILARLDTLKYLEKGGRISKTAAMAGGMLNIKPVVIVKDGEISLLGKARGAKKANNFLNEEIKKSGVDFSLPVLLGYSGSSDELLESYIADCRPLWEEHLKELSGIQIGTVVGTHAGPGAIAVAFFTV